MAAAAALVQTRTAVAGAVRDARAGWGRPVTLGVVVVALAALLPVLPFGLGLDRVASDLYLGAAAVGLGIVVGLGGMPSLGHGALFALGAFGAALVDTKLGWPTEAALVVGVVASAVAGGAVGVVAARLRPALVAVFTWRAAWLVALGLAAFPSISGGAQGIVLDEGSIAGLELSPTVHYELSLFCADPCGATSSVARNSGSADHVPRR